MLSDNMITTGLENATDHEVHAELLAATKDQIMKFLVLFISLFTLIGPASSLAETEIAAVGLDDYIIHALAHNPLLKGVQAQTNAAQHRAEAAGSLPDLKLGWGEMLVPVETRVGPQQRVFSVSQSIPWFGTLGRKEDAALAQADLAAWAQVQKQWDVIAAVRVAWTDLVAWRQEIAVVQEHRALAVQQEATAEAHFSSGSEPFAHALRAQMALVRVDQRLDLLRKKGRVVGANLNSAAGFPVDRPLMNLDNIMALEIHYGNVDYLEMRKHLVAQNPSLKAFAARKDRFNHEVALAGMGGKPNFTIGLDYIMTGTAAMAGVDDSGKDPVIARLGVSLPLWSGRVEKNQAMQAMNVVQASHQMASLQLELERRLEERLYQWEEARDNLHLNREELLPRAQAIHDVENARYESGGGDFADIIDAREELLDLELMVVRLEAQWVKADIGLDALLGNFLGASLNQTPSALPQTEKEQYHE